MNLDARFLIRYVNSGFAELFTTNDSELQAVY